MRNLDILAQQNAWNIMTILEKSINRVSAIRGTYGALSNRIEHNQNSLKQTKLNLDAAESRIRDDDMSKEHLNYVILSVQNQIVQAMLAQSNQNDIQVLQLIQ